MALWFRSDNFGATCELAIVAASIRFLATSDQLAESFFNANELAAPEICVLAECVGLCRLANYDFFVMLEYFRLVKSMSIGLKPPFGVVTDPIVVATSYAACDKVSNVIA